jgi:hypothetical protein
MMDTPLEKKGGTYVEETRNSKLGGCGRCVPRR